MAQKKLFCINCDVILKCITFYNSFAKYLRLFFGYFHRFLNLTAFLNIAEYFVKFPVHFAFLSYFCGSPS